MSSLSTRVGRSCGNVLASQWPALCAAVPAKWPRVSSSRSSRGIRGRRRLAWTGWAGRWTRSSRSPPAPADCGVCHRRLPEREGNRSPDRDFGGSVVARTRLSLRPRCAGRMALGGGPVGEGRRAEQTDGGGTEQVKPPTFEADAVARPDAVIHPVDLGTILVPADWLLLAGGQKAEVEVAVAQSRRRCLRSSRDRLVRVGPGPPGEDRSGFESRGAKREPSWPWDPPRGR